MGLGNYKMKYMGSKARFSREILSIVLKNRQPQQWYVEPFAGGMNMICNVKGNRIANDIHYNLIEMWKELIRGWVPPKITKDEYLEIKMNKNKRPSKYPAHLVGWVGFNCSYSGKWFGGFAGETRTKIGTIRDYQSEAISNVMKQINKMKGVIFQNELYNKLELPPNSVIYCDPPHEGTTQYSNSHHKGATQYSNDFDHEFFWNWVRDISKQGHSVFVSEYNAPKDFVCLWEKAAKSSLSANGKVGGNKLSVEKLFKYVG